MAVQLLNVSSNSTIFTGNGTVTPEQLSEVAALLPAIAFPFLSPERSHGIVLWSSSLNIASYIMNSIFWLHGGSYVHLPSWVLCVTIVSFILGFVAVKSPRYRDLKSEHVSWSGYTVCGLISIYFVRLGGYFITFEHLLTWKNIALILIWCTIIFFSVPGIFVVMSTPISTFFSWLTARRLRWVFFLHRDDIKVNAENKVERYTEVNTQCDSDDDTVYEFIGIEIDSIKDEAGNETEDVANQGAEPDGKPGIQQDAGQDAAQEAAQDPQPDTKCEVKAENPPTWSIPLMVFVCISAPALLVFQYMGLK